MLFIVSSFPYACCCTPKGAAEPALQNLKEESGRLGSRGWDGGPHLVKCRMQNLSGPNFRRAVDYRLQHLEYVFVDAAVIVLGVLLGVPKADSQDIVTLGNSEGDFILETGLFAEQGENVVFHPLGELSECIGFQMNRKFAREHNQPPWLVEGPKVDKLQMG
jgi:hypothetical protein